MIKEIYNKSLKSVVLSFSILVFIGCNLAGKSAAKNENSIGENNAKPEATPTKIVAKTDTKFFGENLIKNGGAETGNTKGWTNTDDNLKTFRWDGGWGDAWQVMPPDKGDSYFYAKVLKDAPIAEFTQKADVSKIAQDIDSNKVSYNLAGWFGLRGVAGVRLMGVFFDANGQPIKRTTDDTDATEKFTSENKPDDVTMVEKTHAGEVPAGTRSIKITLEFRLFEVHPDNEGDVALADNLSLVLTNKGDK